MQGIFAPWRYYLTFTDQIRASPRTHCPVVYLAIVVRKDAITVDVITLPHSIMNCCAAFWFLTSHQTHGCITQTLVPRLHDLMQRYCGLKTTVCKQLLDYSLEMHSVRHCDKDLVSSAVISRV